MPDVYGVYEVSFFPGLDAVARKTFLDWVGNAKRVLISLCYLDIIQLYLKMFGPSLGTK